MFLFNFALFADLSDAEIYVYMEGNTIHISEADSYALTEADGVISFQFALYCDNANYTGFTLGDLASGGMVAANPDHSDYPGCVWISYMNMYALEGTGDLITLEFSTTPTQPDYYIEAGTFLYNTTEITNIAYDYD
ncbi:MAG: hypothetical protein ISS38_03475, partial [Candidatus Cloacimonetes bacterium]|nr:hypothetical protein [Candidatus Cloacimonadota bacterium]